MPKKESPDLEVIARIIQFLNEKPRTKEELEQAFVKKDT
jgi:hypothetical protein